MGMKARPKKAEPTVWDLRALAAEKGQKLLSDATPQDVRTVLHKHGISTADQVLCHHWKALTGHQRKMVHDVLTEQAAKYRLAGAMQGHGVIDTPALETSEIASALRAARMTLEELEGWAHIWKTT